MANRAATIKQADAKRLFKAALDAGFEEVRIILHVDGSVETRASFSETVAKSNSGNTWDDVLK